MNCLYRKADDDEKVAEGGDDDADGHRHRDQHRHSHTEGCRPAGWTTILTHKSFRKVKNSMQNILKRKNF